MSAIAAIVRFHGEPIRDGEMQTLVTSMSSRGPDRRTHWSHGSVALGHALLRTTPESIAETYPLSALAGRFQMIWDGRLDNRDELRSTLQSRGVQPRDQTDPELVMQMFLCFGDRTPEHLLGDFAFAVWDKIEQRLFCARDHVGARPLYYVLTQTCFALASEDEVLIPLLDEPVSPCEDRIARELIPEFTCFDWAQSWITPIKILMPATCMTITRDRRMVRRQYWSPRIPAGASAIRSDGDYREAFRDVFTTAVRDRMRCPCRLGIMMSGGLDSAGVVEAVHRTKLATGDGVLATTYSAVAGGGEVKVEVDSIRTLSAAVGFPSELIHLPDAGAGDANDNLRVAAWNKPHPIDNALTMQLMLCKRAEAQGERVMLHGVSGDVVTDSPTYYLKDRLWRENPVRLLDECVSASQNHTYLADSAPLSLLLRNFASSIAPDQLLRARHWREVHGALAERVNRKLAPQFAQRVGIVDRIWAATEKSLRCRDSAFSRHHLRALFPVGIVQGLEGYERIAGRCGVEFRDPWADRRVVEFFLGLPVDQLVRNGWTKFLARSALSEELPGQVVWRSDKETVGALFSARADALCPETLVNSDARLGQYLLPKPRPLSRASYGQRANFLFSSNWTERVLALWLDRTGV